MTGGNCWKKKVGHIKGSEYGTKRKDKIKKIYRPRMMGDAGQEIWRDLLGSLERLAQKS